MPSIMTALKAAAMLAFPLTHASDVNAFAGYEGYSTECTSCYSDKLTGAFSPLYAQGSNPLTIVCALGNDAIFRPCDKLCVDKHGLSFRQNKCSGSIMQANAKRDTACEICWKSASQENDCLTPYVVAGNEYGLAQCLCQPGKIDTFRQKCDAVCTSGGMSPSQACGMVGIGKRDETTLSTSTTVTTATVTPPTSCNSTTSTVVAPSSTDLVIANSTIPFASGTVGATGIIGVTTTGLPTETAPISNGASALNKVGIAVAGMVATFLAALA